MQEKSTLLKQGAAVRTKQKYTNDKCSSSFGPSHTCLAPYAVFATGGTAAAKLWNQQTIIVNKFKTIIAPLYY